MSGHSFPFKLLAGIGLFLLAAGTWSFAVTYYRQHQADIWLQLEALVEAVTLPYKLAELARQPPVETIPVPVHGVRARDIADTWGEARAAGRNHEGVDIFAERGTPVYASVPGYVIRVGENNLGGRVVMTAGPGGVRYYFAHLEAAAEGIRFGLPVTKDTVIGFVGNSGNASVTPPHLHFGIYHQGPQNPYPFLIDR